MVQRILIENAQKVITRLKSHGFTFLRSKGSHHQFICDHGGKCHLVTVPVHGGKDISELTMKSIIRQSGMTKEVFYAKS